ncbi:unnamed protein product, partial [Staurois parvus]
MIPYCPGAHELSVHPCTGVWCRYTLRYENSSGLPVWITLP